MFKTINQNATGEFVEKKSKFIANIFYIETIEDAEKKIKEIRKKYFDARHNCYAYSIYTKEGIINRFSDDGEPSGTAGAPMLNIITSRNLTNVVVIVTRYFGGILLGTGGLVRAYTSATQEGLKKITEIEMDNGLEVEIEVSYSNFEKFKHYLKHNEIKLIKSEYFENIISIIEISEEKMKLLEINKKNLNFEIINSKILREKYIEF